MASATSSEASSSALEINSCASRRAPTSTSARASSTLGGDVGEGRRRLRARVSRSHGAPRLRPGASLDPRESRGVHLPSRQLGRSAALADGRSPTASRTTCSTSHSKRASADSARPRRHSTARSAMPSRLLADARAIRDPAGADPALARCVRLLSRARATPTRLRRSPSCSNELGAPRARRRAAGIVGVGSSVRAHDLGRASELLDAERRARPAHAVARRGDWRSRAVTLVPSRRPPRPDRARERSRRTCGYAPRASSSAAGRRAEAEAHLAPALAFYREVGATRVCPRSRGASRGCELS